MKNAKHRFGIAIYNEDKKQQFDEIFNKLWKKNRTINKSYLYVGHKRSKQGNILFQINATPFLTYRDFDAFLYELSFQLAKENIGIVLGHNDPDGFFWMDYPERSPIEEATGIKNQNVKKYNL